MTEISSIKLVFDNFGRGWWKISKDNGQYIKFRTDLFTKEEAADEFRNNYDYWRERGF